MTSYSPYRGLPFPGAPTAMTSGVGPFPGMPTNMSFRPQPGFMGDADPITPGAQTTPGVVTATGPTRTVSGGFGGGGYPGPIGLPSIATRPGVIGGGIGFGGVQGAIDADPITPGIQSQPGVVTAVGPPRTVSGPGAIGGGIGMGGFNSGPRPMGPMGGFGSMGVGGGFNPGAYSTATRTVTTGFAGGQFGNTIQGNVPIGFPGGAGGVDIDPITPGIQSQPGVLTATGPSTIVSGPGVMGGLNTTISSGIAGAAFSGGAMTGGIIDADPITPGIQAQPGIVTPTGPPTIVSNGYRSSGAMNNSGFVGGLGGGMLSSGVISGPPIGFQVPQPMLSSGMQMPQPMLSSGMMNSGMQQNFNVGGGFMDVDPISPGIQSQPGVLTATGPSTVVSGGVMGGNFPTGIVDADPITPGIQSQPGIVTATGPSTMVQGGYNTNLGVIGQPQGGIVDADPFTPGIQARPGTVMATGPSVIVGSTYRQGCPWWVWPLLGLLLLGALIGALYSMFRPKHHHHDTEQEDDQQRQVRTQCSGYLNSNGDCVACPQGSHWNGRTCTYKQAALTRSQKTTVDAQQGDAPQGNELPSEVGSQSDSSSENNTVESKNQKVPVFAQQDKDQAIDQALKSSTADNGVAPTVITSKPIASTPTTTIDASNGATSSTQSDYTSTNVVTVPAITKRNSVAPTYTYSAAGVSGNNGGSSSSSRSEYVSKFSSGSGSGSGQGSSAQTSIRTTKTKKKTTTVTTRREEVVNPSDQESAAKHLKRS